MNYSILDKCLEIFFSDGAAPAINAHILVRNGLKKNISRHLSKVLNLCLMLSSFFIITSCTVGPNYRPPATLVPRHYNSQVKSIGDHETHFWYSSFNDPILVSLIREALCGNNLDIQKALANMRQARAQLGISQAAFFPQLDASGKVVRDRISANSEILSAFPPGIIPLYYTDYKYGFDASWEIDVFGHTRRSVEAACARFLSSIENEHNVEIVVTAEVARTYILYRVDQQRILIAESTIRSYEETEKLVRLQMQAGSATDIDLKRIQSQLLSAKSALPPLQADARATLASLAVLVGELPENLFVRLKPVAPIPKMSRAALCVGLPSELLLRRPDIKVAERELAAATADVGVAVSNLFPRFQLIGDIGYDTTKPGTYFTKASSYWSIGPQISLPIFHGGSLRSAVQEQEAIHDAALATYKQTVLQALADVETSLTRYDRERVTKQKLFASFNKLKSSLNLVRLQYREGQTPLLDVLDVQRQLDSLQDQYVQSQGQVTIDLVALYKSLGGCWGV